MKRKKTKCIVCGKLHNRYRKGCKIYNLTCSKICHKPLHDSNIKQLKIDLNEKNRMEELNLRKKRCESYIVCKKCNKRKHKSLFFNDYNRSNGKKANCKDCEHKFKKKYPSSKPSFKIQCFCCKKYFDKPKMADSNIPYCRRCWKGYRKQWE